MKLDELAKIIPTGQLILIKEHKFTKMYDENGISYEEKKEILFDEKECLNYTKNKYLLDKEVVNLISGYGNYYGDNEDYIIIEVE